MSRSKQLFFWTAISAPPLYFYWFLVKSLQGLPVSDDYGAVLLYLLRWRHETTAGRIIQVLTSQNNDYRLMFENAVYGVQYASLGHTNLKALAIMGDLFVLVLFGVLYLIWQMCELERNYTLMAFIPVSWILFQFQYISALDNASAPLQLIPVVVFVLLTCYLSIREERLAFLGSLICLTLSVASSGNGLFIIPIGAIIYIQLRKYKRLMIWSVVSVLICVVYFHRYNFTVEMSHAHEHNNVVGIFKHMSFPFAAAFLGNIATAANPIPAALFGGALIAMFALATLDRLFLRRPTLYYSALFFFVTAVAVSGLRSSYGLRTALGSRYRINSTVLVILLYFYLLYKFRHIRIRPVVLRAAVVLFGLLVVGFNLASNRGGEKLALTMQYKVRVAIMQWQKHEAPMPPQASAPGDYTSYAEEKGYFQPSDPILRDAINQGVYRLPANITEH